MIPSSTIYVVQSQRISTEPEFHVLFSATRSGHTTSDILMDYVSLDPATEMQKYFEQLKPLLGSLVHRTSELGLRLAVTPGDSSEGCLAVCWDKTKIRLARWY